MIVGVEVLALLPVRVFAIVLIFVLIREIELVLALAKVAVVARLVGAAVVVCQQ